MPVPHEIFGFPFQDELDQALSTALGHDPQAGPYSQHTHRLIRANRAYLDSLQAKAQRLVRYCQSHTGAYVLTHGEPNGNVLQADDGRLLLFDWGTLALGPPERDWWALAGHSERITCRPAFARFYHLRWFHSEVAEYTWRLMHTHVGDREDAAMWQELCQYFPP
jgi:hypothetical protein